MNKTKHLIYLYKGDYDRITGLLQQTNRGRPASANKASHIIRELVHEYVVRMEQALEGANSGNDS